MSHIPAYKEVYSKLKEELKEGIYPAGSLLPTESELEKIFHVSRTTIRKAISILSLEGYVKTKQGYGTEVLNIFTVQKLNQITSITETLRQKLCLSWKCRPRPPYIKYNEYRLQTGFPSH